MNLDLDYIQKNKLGLDDTFEFECRQCGQCCHNRDDLILTAYDIFRIAKHLDVAPLGIIEKYCESYIGDESRIPVVRAKPKQHDGVCPFLRKGKCSIHAVKPVICAVFPLGRAYTSENEELYFYQKVPCGDKNTHTVREWIREFGIPEEDSIGRMWSESIIWLAQYMQKVKHFKKDTLNLVWNAIFHQLYLNYDIQRPFEDQLKENFIKLKQLLSGGKGC